MKETLIKGECLAMYTYLSDGVSLNVGFKPPNQIKLTK